MKKKKEDRKREKGEKFTCVRVKRPKLCQVSDKVSQVTSRYYSEKQKTLTPCRKALLMENGSLSPQCLTKERN
jgi:hypothetical protein